MRVARSRAELAGLPRGRTRAVVMTMGALHDGHRALLRAARGAADDVVVTVFVNPLQFGPGEDFERYPRTLDADLGVCAAEGVDAVFAPTAEAVYPDGPPRVRVDPGTLGAMLEGASRPGHFAGVLTVVAKLLGLVRPDLAVFGEKDYQQLVLVRRMAADLELGVGVLAVGTVREPDGLAGSSRNRLLDPAQRRAAAVLPRALRAGAAAAAGGAEPAAVQAAVTGMLATQPGLTVDYVALADRDLAGPPASGPARLLAAVRLGPVRLIDNWPVTLGGGPPRSAGGTEAGACC